MAQLFYGNLDFEHELASKSYNRSRRIGRLNADVGVHMLAFADEGDTLVLPDKALHNTCYKIVSNGAVSGVVPLDDYERGVSQETEFVPWGASGPAQKLGARLTCRGKWPAVSAVVRVNSRGFSFALEQTFESAPPGCCVINSMSDVVPALESAAQTWGCDIEQFRWMLKSEFSMSGRERLIQCGRDLNKVAIGWIGRRLKNEQLLYFEPVLDSIAELSTQWHPGMEPGSDTQRDEQPIGITRLLTDQAGQFVGSQLLSSHLPMRQPSSLEPGEADFFLACMIDAHRKVVTKIRDTGYWGPVGIDAMVYRGPDGSSRLRSVQDINARFTMGRVALEWFKRHPGGESPAWLLIPAAAIQSGSKEEKELQDFGCQLTSPRTLGGVSLSRVGLLCRDIGQASQVLSNPGMPGDLLP